MTSLLEVKKTHTLGEVLVWLVSTSTKYDRTLLEKYLRFAVAADKLETAEIEATAAAQRAASLRAQTGRLDEAPLSPVSRDLLDSGIADAKAGRVSEVPPGEFEKTMLAPPKRHRKKVSARTKPFTYEPQAKWAKKMWWELQHSPEHKFTPMDLAKLAKTSAHKVGITLQKLVREPGSPLRRRKVKGSRAFAYWIAP